MAKKHRIAITSLLLPQLKKSIYLFLIHLCASFSLHPLLSIVKRHNRSDSLLRLYNRVIKRQGNCFVLFLIRVILFYKKYDLDFKTES